MRNAIQPLILLIVLIITGCGQSNPVSVTYESIPFENDHDQIALVRTGFNSFMGVIAAFNVVIDMETLSGEMVPSRKAGAIGDVFDSHITEFLLINPCQNCLKLSSLALTQDGNLAVNFKIRHPFSDRINRPDLHVFDVRGIVLTPGSYFFYDILSDVDGDGNPNEVIVTNPSFLLNADGYTTHFDDSTLGGYFDPPLNYSGNLNPFKNFFIDPGTGAFDPFQPRGFNVMPVNSSWDEQTYIINVPNEGGELSFTLIVDASYGQSATRQNRNSPQYYLPEFNRKEAWCIATEIYENNLEEGKPTSQARVRVLVKDWQAGKNRDSNFPDPNNKSGIKERSDVNLVEITIPDFDYFAIKSRLQAEPGGNGSNDHPYTFNFGPVTAGTLLAGKYFGLVAVRDDLSGLGGPYPISPMPGSDFPSQGPDITDYTAYQVFTVEVRAPGTVGCPPDPIPFYGCSYTQPFGTIQNSWDTVVGISGSPSVMLDIAYGTTSAQGEDRFALEQGGILGVAWDSGPGGFVPFRSGQPGFRVGSIDIDSQNRVIFSGSQLGFTTDVVTVTDRNNNATDTFYVWQVSSLPAQVLAAVDIDPIGTHSKKIMAITVDQNDDVWLIDSNNYMHKYLSSENYVEDTSAGFDLNTAFPSLPSPQAFQGQVFDFVINYYNKAFYILTDHHPNGSLYRIECNGTYHPFYGGNPNPVHGVLIGPHNGLADIVIDNHNTLGAQLDGQQDCQIIVGGGNMNLPPEEEANRQFFFTRINAQLSNPRYGSRQNGAQCIALDPVNNILRVVHGSAQGNEYFSVHREPPGWF